MPIVGKISQIMGAVVDVVFDGGSEQERVLLHHGDPAGAGQGEAQRRRPRLRLGLRLRLGGGRPRELQDEGVIHGRAGGTAGPPGEGMARPGALGSFRSES